MRALDQIRTSPARTGRPVLSRTSPRSSAAIAAANRARDAPLGLSGPRRAGGARLLGGSRSGCRQGPSFAQAGALALSVSCSRPYPPRPPPPRSAARQLRQLPARRHGAERSVILGRIGLAAGRARLLTARGRAELARSAPGSVDRLLLVAARDRFSPPRALPPRRRLLGQLCTTPRGGAGSVPLRPARTMRNPA